MCEDAIRSRVRIGDRITKELLLRIFKADGGYAGIYADHTVLAAMRALIKKGVFEVREQGKVFLRTRS